MTREIALSNGLVALVDDGDYERVAAIRWHAQPGSNGRGWYAIHSKQLPRAKGAPKRWAHLRMHRLILGAEPRATVDHINGNGLDNRHANLRICTQAENSRNRSRSASRSGFRGVTAHGKRWVARIGGVRVPRVHLGVFDTPEDAARAYDAAAVRLYGAFASPNLPASRPSTKESAE